MSKYSRWQLDARVAKRSMPEQQGTVEGIATEMVMGEAVLVVYRVAWDHGGASAMREDMLEPAPPRDVTATAVVDDADTVEPYYPCATEDAEALIAEVESVFTPEDVDFLLDAGVAPM